VSSRTHKPGEFSGRFFNFLFNLLILDIILIAFSVVVP